MKELEIVIAFGGMPCGPDTLLKKSLGGSETAALSLAKELKNLGHMVSVFCNLPDEGAADYIAPGSMGADGVRYVPIEQFAQFITSTSCDLLIAARSPEMIGTNHQAKKAVLWCHDLATYNGPAEALKGVSWNFDEIWCVSEWHADQYSKISGYPRDHIKVLRNAITKWDVMDFGQMDKKQLVYAARPERGLEALVRPGGIMALLPDYTLNVCMYDNYPEHMKPYYDRLFSMMGQLPNVKFHGPLDQLSLRQLIKNSGAYVYPTDFEETSCIMAQETMEQLRPFITCRAGALSETLGDFGTFYEGDKAWASDEFCADFADVIKNTMENHQAQIDRLVAWEPRYWSDAAKDVELLSQTKPVLMFSKVWSLVEDSDIVPALAVIDAYRHGAAKKIEPYIDDFYGRLKALYPYLFDKETFAAYYERYFLREDTKGARTHRSSEGMPRFEAIANQVKTLPDGAHILDYGCAEGVIILDLAVRFPRKRFTGIDFAPSNIKLCREYAEELKLENVEFYAGSTDDWPADTGEPVYDAAICSEVLEHVVRPWETILYLERKVKLGGRVITTVPMGPWEAIGLYDKEQYNWRAHIWHIDKWMLRQRFGDKSGCQMMSLPNGAMPDGRAIGHLIWCYDADHKEVCAIDPLEKASRAHHRETVTAAIITNDSDTIRKTLRSIALDAQIIKISCTSKDLRCRLDLHQMVAQFRLDHPWIFIDITVDEPIAPGSVGFDDARNKSVEGVCTDWVLWIDSDEYLSGGIRKYLRNNAFDSYGIYQHHFSVDPRGAPAQLDKPARLFRTDRGFKFYGKVHEHAEKGFNGGPGFCMVLGDVDIGHIGYVNEQVRRDRFGRNFPLLEWDHKEYPDRKIGKFLWLRDIIHRMRYHAEHREIIPARQLAEEAISYYNAEWSDWTEAGMGGENAVAYYSEAMELLGRGVHLEATIQVDKEVCKIAGRFDTHEEATKMFSVMLKMQYEKRLSKYWV